MPEIKVRDFSQPMEWDAPPIDLEKQTFTYRGRSVDGERLAQLLGLKPTLAPGVPPMTAEEERELFRQVDKAAK